MWMVSLKFRTILNKSEPISFSVLSSTFFENDASKIQTVVKSEQGVAYVGCGVNESK